MFRALESASYDITYESGGSICYGHWNLCLVISQTRQGVRFVTGFGICTFDISHETGGTVCYRHCGSASCDITYETGGTICYGHWVLCLVISYMRQGVRCVTGLGFYVL